MARGPLFSRCVGSRREKASRGENVLWVMDMVRAKVLEWVQRHGLLPGGSRILAACSGGPDSLTLLDLLSGLRHELQFTLYAAHFEHGLRGRESRQDAEFVRQFCADRQVGFFCGHGDVPGELKRRGGSLEETARNLRYEFLRETAGRIGGALLATGHHRDDQAETVLLNLLRGSGGRGLGAIRPRQGDVVRPILCLSRCEIEAYCSERELRPRTDISNADLEFRRNRIRHALLPLLRRDFNPAVADVLCRTADILSEEQDYLRVQAERCIGELVTATVGGCCMDAGAFAALHPALQREVVLRLLEKLRGDLRGIAFTHVEQIRTLFQQESGEQRIDLPGRWQARKSYARLFIEKPPEASTASSVLTLHPDGVIRLNCPGETLLPEFGMSVRCSVHSGGLAEVGTLSGARAVFDPEAIRLPLTVRQRRPGDRFRPLGAAGSRKVKELMIDLKIPVEKRHEVPIVCDGRGILWVVGCRRSERGKLAADAGQYILMEFSEIRDSETNTH